MPSSLLTADDRFLWGLLAALIALAVVVGRKTGAGEVELNACAPYKQPIIALELNAGEAPEMFKSWDEETKNRLRRALAWDYIFIFIYPAAIATACLIAGKFLHAKGIIGFRYSLIVIAFQFVAAILDGIENFALLRVLKGPIEGSWPHIARWCAIFKFGFVFLGIGYALVIGGGAWLISLISS